MAIVIVTIPTTWRWHHQVPMGFVDRQRLKTCRMVLLGQVNLQRLRRLNMIVPVHRRHRQRKDDEASQPNEQATVVVAASRAGKGWETFLHDLAV